MIDWDKADARGWYNKQQTIIALCGILSDVYACAYGVDTHHGYECFCDSDVLKSKANFHNGRYHIDKNILDYVQSAVSNQMHRDEPWWENCGQYNRQTRRG